MKTTLIQHIRRIFIFLIGGLVFAACEKEELPIPPVDRGGVKTFQAEMGNNYENQLWIDIESGEIISSQNRYTWDIAFEGSGENGFVFLNGAKMVRAALSDKSWEETTASTGLTFSIDASNGRTDSLVIGDWKSHKKIIVIDKGYTAEGRPAGYVKLELISLTGGKYTFRYANLNGSSEQAQEISVNADYNTLMYSFDEHKLLNHQPKKNEYDLFFTQYATHLYETGSTTPTDYLVNGALLNPTNVLALYLPEESFENVTEDILSSVTLSNQQDAIGYDWKSYNFDTGTYVVNSKKTFLVQDRKGFVYKMHFIDFYNNKGEKGTPTVEYQKL